MAAFASLVFIRVRIDGKWESVDLIDPRVSGEQAADIVRNWTDPETLQTLVIRLAGMCRMFLNKGKS